MIPPTLSSLAAGPDALDRRQWLAGASALATLFGLRHPLAGWFRPAATTPTLAFKPVPISYADALVLPEGYEPRVFFPWGTPVKPTGPAWSLTNSAEDQRQQAGMHHDGIAFFAKDAHWDSELGRLVGSSSHGYLVVNHECTDEGLLHADGVTGWSAEKVRKSKAAVGVSVIEIQREAGEWRIVNGRRITALDEIEVHGPARGHALLRTTGSADTPGERDGTSVEGTMANCAHGETPWGTYLTCEENFQDYFARTKPTPAQVEALTGADRLAAQRMSRYGIGDPAPSVDGWRSTYGWQQFDPRFDADAPTHRHHCHRFGWVVEIDPRDPARRPAKRTALGRFRHENAAVVIAPDGRVVVYMGDDARFEYVYKFVSARAFEPELATDDEATRERKRAHNWTLLDTGKLYAARFDAGDTGSWLELSLANPKIRESGAFLDPNPDAEIAVFARHAADLAGASRMDRPEWIAVDQDPKTRRIRHAYVSLTNNNRRGMPDALEGASPANPRVDNIYGHIVRWRETDGDPTATTFHWSLFVLAGHRRHPVAEQRGTIKDAAGSTNQDFGSPDGLTMDPRGGVLWVQTDVSASLQSETPYRALGNNQMLAIDVATGEVRRFLTGPRGCEITGLAFTPDCKTMFVNVQHPGERGDEFSDPNAPLAVSAWPAGATDHRPRSATVIVERRDGGTIGT